MQHGHVHADTDMDMLHENGIALGQGHAEWTWASSMEMVMQHGNGHAAWTWNEHGPVMTWTCRMDMDRKNGH